MFSIYRGKGFHVTFENDVTVSVQFGYGNYCENRDEYEKLGGLHIPEFVESADAEIAIWQGSSGKDSSVWITREFMKEILNSEHDDDVLGYCNADTVLKALVWAENYNKEVS